MYNLIVQAAINDTMSGERMLLATDAAISQYIAPDGVLVPSRLLRPTLLLSEANTRNPEDAQLGVVTHLTSTPVPQSRYRPATTSNKFLFVPAEGSSRVPVSLLVEKALALGIETWEFTRTHWSVKDVDLRYTLFPSVRAPTYAQEQDLVAVMMPFSGTGAVYAALREAVVDAGMRCQRVDEIWQEDVLVDDVIDLIKRARIVIVDYSGRNPNVFYEAGIAHTLGRDVVPVAQNEQDVPFDVAHRRFVKYHNNGEGLATMKAKVTERLRTLTSRSVVKAG